MIPSNPAAFAVLAQENRIIRIFQHAGAIKSFKAIMPEDHGIARGFIFNKLVRKGILLQVHDGRYYLNEARAKEVSHRRREIFGIILMVIAIIVLIAVFWQSI